MKEKQLTELGWRIVTIWECQLKPKRREETLLKLLEKLEAINESNK